MAGIKVWVLTGDKVATAENVGKLSGLLDDETNTYRLILEPNINEIQA